MSIGYTRYLIEANSEAPDTLGVRLGKWAIKHDVPASQVALEFGVSRQTVYNWFMGKHEPKDYLVKQIRYRIRRKP